MRSATPTQTAAMCRRPLSSTFIAVLKPTPSRPPIRLAAGTRQSLEDHVAGVRALLAHLAVGLPIESPGVPRSTTKAEIAAAPVAVGSVRAMTVKMPASGALVMKRLVPFST